MAVSANRSPGPPLTSYDVVVQSIAATWTRSGLQVDAELDTRRYPLGIAVSKAQLKSLPIEYHDTHGAWNYTVRPEGCRGEDPVQATDRDTARRRVLDLLADPMLTGMDRGDRAALTAKTAPECTSCRTRTDCPSWSVSRSTTPTTVKD
uniref:ISAzo13-like element transposase-related protein n=1 Tax=Streptomyces lancefieldiae TaxID=3075520 RepID=UPI00374E07D0